jgi:hypothetical protein
MLKNNFHIALGDVIGRNVHTINDPDIEIVAGFFSYPEKAMAHTESVSFLQECSFSDLNFYFKVRLQNIAPGARFGIQGKCRTDGFDGEHITFVFQNGNLEFVTNNTTRQVFTTFNLQSLEGQVAEFRFQRVNDRYRLYFNGQVYERQYTQDGSQSVYRQNIIGALYGSGIDVEPLDVRSYTEAAAVKFGLLGDSIANGYTPPGGYAQTIGGIMTLEKGLSFYDFAGSANVVKDSLDAINEIAAVRPRYAVIMYGHNDLLFATGRLETDHKKLVHTLQNYGITPVVCTMCLSQWVDITPANEFIRATYFNDRFLHIDLEPVLSFGAGDYYDIAHPNSQGNRKLAEAIFAEIEGLP